jgi:hypothetical protein
MLPGAFYEPDGDVFLASAATSGPWSPDAQHAGPPSGLLSRAIEQAAGIEGGQTARITFDILRPVPVAPLRVETRLLRGGKRVELLEATLLAAEDGAELMRARAWRVRHEPVAFPDGIGRIEPPPVGPEGFADRGRPSFWEGDVVYWDALEWRAVAGDFEVPGPAVYWSRLRIPLIAGEPTTPLQHLLIAGDAASGISSTLDWQAFNFANVDFSVALERPPAGEWLAMDAVTRPGPVGAGVCNAVLFDTDGRVGSSTQSLLIAAR